MVTVVIVCLSQRYNNKLAELAQEWSARCYWGHRPRDSFSASNYGFSAVGENLYAGTGDEKTAPAKAIQAWFDEKNFYVYNTGQCIKEPCGHYTAVGLLYFSISNRMQVCNTFLMLITNTVRQKN